MLLYLKRHPSVFDAEEVGILTAAFDKAWQLIQASGARFETDGEAENLREVLAKHLIDTAKRGERDPQLLEGALVGYTHGLKSNGASRPRLED